MKFTLMSHFVKLSTMVLIKKPRHSIIILRTILIININKNKAAISSAVAACSWAGTGQHLTFLLRMIIIICVVQHEQGNIPNQRRDEYCIPIRRKDAPWP